VEQFFAAVVSVSVTSTLVLGRHGASNGVNAQARKNRDCADPSTTATYLTAIAGGLLTRPRPRACSSPIDRKMIAKSAATDPPLSKSK
jgi:hypothetical protein